MVHKPQKFIFHSSRDWVKVLADLVSGESPLPGSPTATFLLYSVEKGVRKFPGLFHKGVQLPKSPLPNTIGWVFVFQHLCFEGTQTFSLYKVGEGTTYSFNITERI